jgi:hypothetical protein
MSIIDSIRQYLKPSVSKTYQEIVLDGSDKEKVSLMKDMVSNANEKQRELDRKYEQMMNQAAQ